MRDRFIRKNFVDMSVCENKHYVQSHCKNFIIFWDYVSITVVGTGDVLL